MISFPELNALVSCETQRLKNIQVMKSQVCIKDGVTAVYTGQLLTVHYIKRPNPKSLTGDKVDSSIGLPMINVLESTLEST